jgi:uncharacterized protein YjiS (DUF1127 family)
MLIASVIALFRRYFRYRSQLESISQLDERTLRDIGLSRGEIVTAAWRYTAPAISVIAVPIDRGQAKKVPQTKKARIAAGLSDSSAGRCVSA